MRSHTPATRVFHLLLTVAFVFNLISPVLAQEVDLKLPPPSKIKAVSKPFAPAIIRAVTVNPNDPFLFDFIIDKGDSNLDAQAFEDETQKLVKYFLAALTIPENDLWVNLSPYEQDSMVPRVLGVTEMGKDLLIADYYLKQVGAALTNPNTETGKKFWDLAYAKAKELYGTTKVPINTFSKVWIVPDQAVVLEKDGSAFVADSRLKVYLDQDYVAIKKNLDNKEIGTDKIGSDKAQDINAFSAQIIKEVVLPEIEKEVNSGENFAMVRQIYSSAILASWYKKRLKESLLGKLYADQNKVAGVNAEDMDSGDKIFEKYTAALKTGAYNIIKQDFDLSTQKVVQRKYFSGGVKMAASPAITYAQVSAATAAGQAFSAPTPAATQAVLAFSQGVTAAQAGVSGVAGQPASFASGNYQYAKATVRLGQPASSVVVASSNAISRMRTAPAETITSFRQYAPEIPLSGFLALAQATRNEDGSFNETRFNNYVSNFNASKGAAPISVSQQQDLRAAVVAVQSSLSSLSGQQTPVTLMAESLRNPTVSAGLNVLSTNRNFAAQMFNSGDRATNTAVSEYASTVNAVSAMSAQEIGPIAESANVSAADQAAITKEIAQPNFRTMSTVQQTQAAPTLARVVAENPDFNYAVFAQAFAKANLSQANASLTENKNWELLLKMPDAQLQQHFENFLKSEGLTSRQAQEAAKTIVITLRNVPTADLKTFADLGRAIYTANKSNPNPVATTRQQLQIVSLAISPSATRTSPSLRAVDYIRNLFAPDVNAKTLRESVVSALPNSKYTPDQKEHVAEGLIALKEQSRTNKDFALQVGFATTVDEFKQIVRNSGYLNEAQIAAFENLSDQDVRKVGGIDLSAERMDLKIKRDGNGVVLPVADQDLQNLKIDGLSPVILDVQPATPASVPFLMNLGNSAQAK